MDRDPLQVPCALALLETLTVADVVGAAERVEEWQ